jgi:diguanylate cyclase (GGDEF)-like protein
MQAVEPDVVEVLDRRRFLDVLGHRAQANGCEGAEFALLVIDVNRFRDVNSAFGQKNGDLLLGLLAQRLSQEVWPGCLVGHLGADRFAVLLPEVGASDCALREASRAHRLVREPFRLAGEPLPLSTSMGVALCPDHGSDADELLRSAEDALYVAKDKGEVYCLYSSTLPKHPMAGDRFTLLADLREAIQRDQLELHYQPQIELSCGVLRGAEALVRWRHPTRGLIPPDQFIWLAESSGLIQELSRWVLQAACEQSRVWRSRGFNLGLSVNFSMKDMQEPSLPEFVQRVLHATQADSSWICVELTESVFMGEPELTLRSALALDEMGVALSIDDFGTGYSSLAYLKQLPMTELKVDKAFVADMLVDESDALIVRSTINLAHSLGLEVVAEGVETAATWASLSLAGCDVAQGYFISRPQPAADFEAWVSNCKWSLDRASALAAS